MQLDNFIDVILARRVSGTYAHHQDHWMLSCSIWFSAVTALQHTYIRCGNFQVVVTGDVLSKNLFISQCQFRRYVNISSAVQYEGKDNAI